MKIHGTFLLKESSQAANAISYIWQSMQNLEYNLSCINHAQFEAIKAFRLPDGLRQAGPLDPAWPLMTARIFTYTARAHKKPNFDIYSLYSCSSARF